jgi:hypothetical protein
MKKKLKKVTKRLINNKMNCQGDYDEDTHVIRINKKKSKKKSSIISTIIHEELGHAEHPKAYEKTVRKMEMTLGKKLGPKQKSKLYARYKGQQKDGKQWGYKKHF